MTLNKILKNTLLLISACLLLSACATQKTVTSGSQMQGDVYTGTDTVKELAPGVPDRVFFATNESILTTASRETLRKQAEYLRKNDATTRRGPLGSCQYLITKTQTGNCLHTTSHYYSDTCTPVTQNSS